MLHVYCSSGFESQAPSNLKKKDAKILNVEARNYNMTMNYTYAQLFS